MEASTSVELDLASDSIVPVSAGPIVEERCAVLLWVHTGQARVEVGGTSNVLTAGQAVWIPPGVKHETSTDGGSVVFPLLVSTLETRRVLSEISVVDVPSGWENWLIHKYNFGTSIAANPLFELPISGNPDPAEPLVPVVSLPMPQSREALAVAHTLLRTPATSVGIEELARRVYMSPRTLRRQFVTQTGLQFSEWRTHARITVALGQLANGLTIGQARRAVGYFTPAGFTAAFRRILGMTPQEYVKNLPLTVKPKQQEVQLAERIASIADGYPCSQAGGDDHSFRLKYRDRQPFLTLPPPIPAYQGPTRINDCHVLLWVYRGNAHLHIGNRDWKLQQGQAIWVPAGAAHEVSTSEGGILLPLGNRYGRFPVDFDNLTIFTFDAKAEPMLLHTVLAEYSLLKPHREHRTLTTSLFQTQFYNDKDTVVGSEIAKAIGAIAQQLYQNPADSRSLADWATRLDVDLKMLSAEFTNQTATTFPRWRAQLRMEIARHMLELGETPSAVSRRLGYAHPAGFTKLFTRSHGLPPREYQREIWGDNR